jgi:N6-L-threonylcarbamoyladenine synthase
MIFRNPAGEGKYDFSYSGLKTSVINLVNTLKMKGEPVRLDDMARSFQDVAIGMILEKATQSRPRLPCQTNGFGGGRVREFLSP